MTSPGASAPPFTGASTRLSSTIRSSGQILAPSLRSVAAVCRSAQAFAVSGLVVSCSNFFTNAYLDGKLQIVVR